MVPRAGGGATMPEVDIYNMAGEKSGRLALSEAVFGPAPNEAVLHQVITALLAAKRQGTVNTKTRGEVRGGGKKPWRQKGTGRARHGSRRAPDFRGGGTVHGPHPRSYRQAVSRKLRQEALRSALVSRLGDNDLCVIDALRTEEPKTKVVAQMLSALSATGRVVLVTTGMDQPTSLSVRNLPKAKSVHAQLLCALDVLNCDKIIATCEAVAALEGRLS
ncbi:MAG: 50S ribosomal protein L4 [Armatimonadetes bacterium CG_4_10_14_3_um_filter_66_18]|nr:MAG: 50S ribosomal protein L4 [Armatimonadetes bacterium CG06_land_8_20_14_3_00_66_21]PIX43072.1 MAG: 50S ribosomal protein L4 [Armatimonadetes bacterium CG_4_8_14_3_um_filter_66_20]PIY36208.1 MAG: 50S ribosomal protein L4 [Armatimonadetes bacterium CG_4_10_14_3_um_filter_66_18]PIZ50391.1 MAG: 50S ribosomal protein L4 [Armatimonadetes bacterium CG_4_10_14_0_8_um_filter_66_14]PJB71668.1 MAG: 50S ribosomal protein L4 [Armatimonadetes bacterium CG_4_9_14_3_um_filter_66_14]